jgi:hypothetical protein
MATPDAPAARQLGHLIHDAVTVPRATGQRREHEERLSGHGRGGHGINILGSRILVERPCSVRSVQAQAQRELRLAPAKESSARPLS